MKTLLKLAIIGLIAKWVIDRIRERRPALETGATTTTTGRTGTSPATTTG